MTQQTETKSMTEQETAEVAIFSETLTALQEERPVPIISDGTFCKCMRN